MSNDEAYFRLYQEYFPDKEKDEPDDWLINRSENIELFAERTCEKNMETVFKDRSSYNSKSEIAKLKEKNTT